MPKTALHFGAGNIGRGFITPILQENGYDVVLVDVDSDLVNKLNTDQEYSVNFIGSSKESTRVSNIKALNLSDSSEIQSLISNCDFVSTSVGPQYVNSVLDLISNLDLLKSINFVAFENKYRASTTAKNELDINNKNITFIDVVIDKIVPLQSKDSLDVYVEEYGSIVFDKEGPLPLKPSDVIKQGEYDYEFKKKLWMLNGLHLCLAYYGLSEKYQYMHELYQNDASKAFIDQISLEILESLFLLGKEEIEELTKFKNTINERFSNPEIKDQLFRVARNPAIKFSYNERFQEPLDILIKNDKSVAGFKKVLNIIFNLSFGDIEGFNDFKKEVLELGRPNFYKNFWNQDKNYEKYLNMLGD